MEFYISPQSGQFYMINVLENQWLSVTYNATLSVPFVDFFSRTAAWICFKLCVDVPWVDPY